MRRLVGALGVVAVLALAAPAADPLAFTEFESKDGKYKVLLPGKPETAEKKVGKLTVHSASVRLALGKESQVFTVSHFDLDVALPAAQAQAALKAFAGGVKGKALSDEEKTLGKAKLPARDSVFVTDKGVHVRNFLALDGQRVYHLVVAAPTKDAVTSKDANKFIESFEVVK